MHLHYTDINAQDWINDQIEQLSQGYSPERVDTAAQNAEFLADRENATAERWVQLFAASLDD